jgi:signal peptidase II
MRSRLNWLALPVTALALDWASKLWVLARLKGEGDSLAVIPGFFNLTIGYNTGAIFGSLQGLNPKLRSVLFAAAALLALVYFGRAFLSETTPRLERVALGMILGGALGNGLDRLLHGHVVDFLDFVFGGWHYWTFNVADSFIVCGAILFGIGMLKEGLRPKAEGPLPE